MASRNKVTTISTSKRHGNQNDDTLTNDDIDQTKREPVSSEEPINHSKDDRHKEDTPNTISVNHALIGLVITFLAAVTYLCAKDYYYHKSNVDSKISSLSSVQPNSYDLCDTTKQFQTSSSEYAPTSDKIENTPDRQGADKISPHQKESPGHGINSKQTTSPVILTEESLMKRPKEYSHCEKDSQSFEVETSSRGTESATEQRPAASPEKGECAIGWTKHNGSCYKFFDINKSWKLSKSSCESFGSHLLTIDTWPEQTFLKNTYVPKFVTNRTSMAELWLGGEYSGDAWRWISTNQLIDPKWSSWGQRGAASHRLGHCLCYVILDYNYCKMYDNNCNYSRPYICERER